MKTAKTGGGGRRSKRIPCANCGARSTNLILPKEPIGNVTLPPFPVCRQCSDRYKMLETQEEERRFILEMATETLRRLRTQH